MELEKEGPQSGPYVLGDGGEAATKSARGTRPPMITDLMQGKHPPHSSSGGYSNSQRHQIFAGGWNGNCEIISAGRKNCGISSDGSRLWHGSENGGPDFRQAFSRGYLPCRRGVWPEPAHGEEVRGAPPRAADGGKQRGAGDDIYHRAASEMNREGAERRAAPHRDNNKITVQSTTKCGSQKWLPHFVVRCFYGRRAGRRP